MRRTRTDYAICYVVTSGLSVMLSKLANAFVGMGSLAFIFILSVIIAGAQIFFATGRLKDMNANPWWAVLTILPFVGFIFCFPKGIAGINRYGEDPRLQKSGSN